MARLALALDVLEHDVAAPGDVQAPFALVDDGDGGVFLILRMSVQLIQQGGKADSGRSRSDAPQR